MKRFGLLLLLAIPAVRGGEDCAITIKATAKKGAQMVNDSWWSVCLQAARDAKGVMLCNDAHGTWEKGIKAIK